MPFIGLLISSYKELDEAMFVYAANDPNTQK